MKFGKEFRSHLEETLPEWRDKFLCYKPLKKILKRFTNTNIPVNNAGAVDLDRQAVENDNANGGGGVGTGGAVAGPRGADPSQINPRNMTSVEFQEWFVRFLNEELEKFNDFYVDKEEEFVIRLQELKERIERMQVRRIRDGVAVSESEFSEEMMDIRKEFVTIHGEMVLLKNYSSLNFAGLVKILKKYDKRTGGLLRLPFTQLAVHQPFSTTEPLTRLVRECEANLELLFPMEDEVIESTTSALGNQHSAPFNDITNIPSEAASLGDANFDIYRSTLSAMRTIQGLRRSSTYNPLSFATLFRNQDDEGSGAVTAENSASNSAASSDEDDLKTVEPKDSGSAP